MSMQLSAGESHASVPQDEGGVYMIGLNEGVTDLDPAKPLMDLYLEAGRQYADTGTLDRGLLEQIEAMRGELIADESGDAVNRAMHGASDLLEAEGVDWATGTRKVSAAPVVGGMMLPKETTPLH